MRMGNTKAGPRRARRAPAAAGVRHMAHRFIVGETPARRRSRVMRELWQRGIATSVDLLGEATVTAGRGRPLRGALRATRSTRSPKPTRRCRSARCSSTTRAGPIPRANLSVKVSALTPLLRPDAPERGKDDAAPRLRELLRHAKRAGAHLHIDMESFDSREAITDLVLELLAEDEFRDGPCAGHRPAGLPARLARSCSSALLAWARRPAASTRSSCAS